jgi:hypothetical protein
MANMNSAKHKESACASFKVIKCREFLCLDRQPIENAWNAAAIAMAQYLR